MFHYIYYIYFIIGLIIIEVHNEVAIEDENNFINYLASSNKEVTLNINSEIDITKEIVLNDSIKILSIIGDSTLSTKLNLKYPFYFDTNLEKIEIKNININGNLIFKKNNKKITLENVNLNGYIDSDLDSNSNNNIEITNLTYKPSMTSVKNCINLSGNIKINKSNFYGNSSCQNRLLYYNGFEKYKIELKESNFNGNDECPFLSIENALEANIETSYFEKGYSSKSIDGGYIKNKIKYYYYYYY